ncbi:MAG: Gfo/Idh/MocA family oxidoreductase, partial [Clostridia bacterium]|nr:Gfo/Idh/MocA family oxidoreductase [Clostridia bacterium]
MNKKKVAIVGYGGMGGWHVRNIQASDVVELAGIWDIKESRRNMALEKGIHVYSSYEDLLA